MRAHTFILKILYPYQSYQIGHIFSILLINLGVNAKPYLIKILVDDTLKNQNNLITIISLYILSDFIRTAGWLLNDVTGFVLYPRLSSDIISYFTRRLSFYKYSFFQDTQTGSITSKLNEAFTNIPTLLNTIYNVFISLLITLLITLYLLFKIHFIFSVSLESFLYYVCYSFLWVTKKYFPLLNSTLNQSLIYGVILPIISLIS